MNSNNLLLTRRQLWKKCTINRLNNNLRVEYIEGTPKINKKVTFSNITYLKFIPTRQELKETTSCFNSYIDFIN